MSPTPTPAKVLPAPLVALASWVLPGLGYFLIGQRKRAVTVGVTILLLFVLGLLIGGVRVLEVPGYGPNGGKLWVVTELRDGEQRTVVIEDAEPRRGRVIHGGALRQQPMAELRQKPWSIAQVLNGPVALLGMAWSAQSARLAPNPAGPDLPRVPSAEPSHARVNEIGVLYTAVAGMLNLLAIIDAASRAGNLQEKPIQP